jgi:methanogenic corrinoid protein MtbC1
VEEPEVHTTPRHPIGVVSSRTGLPQDLIRAWERRYRAVVPARGETGRRLYSDDDIDRLRLLKRAVAGGRRISDVAGIGEDELRALVEEDGAAAAPARPHPTDGSAEAIFQESMEALESMDGHRLQKSLADAAISLSSPHLRQRVIVPLLRAVGERWREGTLRIAQEHMASAIVRSFLGTLRNGKNGSARRLLVTTPAGQNHELGALLAANAADEAGWDVIYLGPNLPAEEVAAGARQLAVDAVALSVIYSDNERHTQEEIRRLRGYLDPSVPLFVGGRALVETGLSVESDGVHFVTDLEEFQERLARVAGLEN